MATLTTGISADDREIRITGDVSAITQGLRFRLDDELLDLSGYEVHPLVNGYRAPGPDRNHWTVNRGVGGSTAAAHNAGTTLMAAISASISSDDLVPPTPFADTGSDGFTNPLTEPLSIAPTATDTNALLVTIPTGAAVPGVKIAMDEDHPYQAFVITAGSANVMEIYRGKAYFATNNAVSDAFFIEPVVTLDVGKFILNVSGTVTNTMVLRTGHLALASWGTPLPADAELANGVLAFAYDETNGAAKLLIKAKTTDGTVVTGEVALA